MKQLANVKVTSPSLEVLEAAKETIIRAFDGRAISSRVMKDREDTSFRVYLTVEIDS